MRVHLFSNKKKCPALRNDVELTDEIKNHILENRVYIIKTGVTATPVTTTTNIINNYHVMNSLLSSMDPVEKITKYINYKNLEITDIDDHIEEKFIVKTKRLEGNKYKNFSMSIQDMLEVVDSVTTMCQVENFNIIYDDKLNKLKVFTFGTWKSSLIDGGIKELIEKIQSCYLDSYECFLLRKYNNGSVFEMKQASEHIEEYYKFISFFDITPYVLDKNNNQIIYNSDDERFHQDINDSELKNYSIQDHWYPSYKKIRDNITVKEYNKITKTVTDIIKRNSRNNVVELNKKMMELFQMDETFKVKVINEITSATQQGTT